MNALRPLFPCYWCQWAICTNAGTGCSCQDKCQRGPPCSSPSLWSWVYYTRLWKSLASRVVRSGTAGALGKVWFPDRRARVEGETGSPDLLVTFFFPQRFRHQVVCSAKTLVTPTICSVITTFHLLFTLTVEDPRASKYVGHGWIIQLSVFLFKADSDSH